MNKWEKRGIRKGGLEERKRGRESVCMNVLSQYYIFFKKSVPLGFHIVSPRQLR